MNLPIHIPFIALATLAGLFMLFRMRLPLHLALFPFFLMFTIYIEVNGYLLGSKGINNTIYFNIFSIVGFDFYLYLIYHYIQSRIVKILIIIAAVSYTIVASVNLIFYQGLHQFNTLSYAFNSLLIIIFCGCFFFEVFTRQKAENLLRNPGFWIVTGLLIFTISTLPLLGLANFITQLSQNSLTIFQGILRISNVLLYLLFTIAFLCRINSIPKSTSLS